MVDPIRSSTVAATRFVVSTLFAALWLSNAVAPALASPADDQYVVAAGHYADGRWQLAAEEFAKLLEQFPDYRSAAQARFFQGEALVQLRQFDAAREALDRFIAAAPESRYVPHAQFRIGEASYVLRDWERARKALEAFHQEHPKDALSAYLLNYLGHVRLHFDDAAGAETLFRRHLANHPGSALADGTRLGLAKALSAQQRHTEARQLWQALSAKPLAALADEAQFALGAAQNAAGEYQQAAETFKAFEGRFAKSRLAGQARLAQGWALFHLERYEPARILFQQLAKANGETAQEARYWLGLTQYAQHDWAAAAETLTRLAEQLDEGAPRQSATGSFDAVARLPAIRYHAGDAWRRAGRRDAARKLLRRVVAAAEEDGAPQQEEPARQGDADTGNASWVDESLLALLQAELDDGNHAQIDALSAEVERRSPEAALRLRKARIVARSLMDRRRYGEAIKTLEALVADDTNDDGDEAAADRYLLAAAYQGGGEHQLALDTLRSIEDRANGDLAADAALLEATVLVSLNLHAEAAKVLGTFLDTHPESEAAAKAHAQRAVCLALDGQFDVAQTELDALGDAKDPQLRLETMRRVAEAALDGGQVELASKLFADLRAADSTAGRFAAEGLFGLAWAAYQREQFEQAVKLFEKLIEAHPKHALVPAAALAAGQLLERLDKLDEALAHYRLIDEQHAESREHARALLRQGAVYERQERSGDAAKVYARLLDEFPQFSARDEVLYKRAWVLQEAGRTAASRALLEQLYREHPTSRLRGDVAYRLAQLDYENGDYRRSEKLLNELIDPAQGDVSQSLRDHARYLLGQVAVAQQQWDEAGKILAPLAAGETPLTLPAAYWLAEADYQQRRFAEARKRFDALAEKTAEIDQAWVATAALRRGQLLVRDKQWTAAREVLESIGDRFADFDQQYEADYLIGRSLAAEGRLSDARAEFEKVIRAERGGKTETAAKAQWMIGESYYHQKNYRRALAEFLRVEILYGYPLWQAGALIEAGKCYELLGEPNEAAKLYRRLLEKYPETTFRSEASRRLQAIGQRLGNTAAEHLKPAEAKP